MSIQLNIRNKLSKTLAGSIKIFLYIMRLFNREIIQKNLNHFCLFLCFLLLILVVYYDLPTWLELICCSAILSLSAVGSSFLDYRERIYETWLETKQLEDARRLLALGVDSNLDGTAKALKPVAETLQVESYKPYQISVANSIKHVARSSKLILDLLSVSQDKTTETYLFALESGTLDPKSATRLSLQIRNNLELSGLPKISQSGNNISVSINTEWIGSNLLAP